MAIDFMDLASRYANARLDQATQPFTDPEGYLNQRMQQNYGVDIYGNTRPKSTTIAYNDDGTQTITQKHEVTPPDQGASSYMPDETQAETQRLLAQNAAAAPAPAPMPAPVSQPQPMVQPQAMPSAQLPPPVEIGPGVQVAGPMVQPPPPVSNQTAAPVAPVAETRSMPAPAPAPAAPVSPYAVAPQNVGGLGIRAATTPAPEVAPAAQAPVSIGAEPHYSDDFRNIYNKPNELAKYMGNDANPEAGRKVAADLLKIHLNGVDAETEANKKLTAMAQGDQKATNQVMRDLRSENGSWVKAILFARLGLNDLAKEEQGKLSTERKMGRAILDGENFAVVTNNQGAITKAYDDAGNSVNDRTLAKLNSSAVLQGTHAYGFTGEPAIVTDPNGKQAEVRQRTNSITGKIENVYITGTNAGKLYTGDEIPIPKSISTSAAKADYKVISGLREKFGTNVLDAEKQYQIDNGPFASQAARDDFRQKYGFVSGMPGGGPGGLTISGAAPGSVSTATTNVPAAAGVTAATAPAAGAGAGNAPVGNQPVALGAAPIRSNYASDSQYKMAVENYNKLRDYNLAVAKEQASANIQQKKELNVAEQKPPAEAKGGIAAKDINNQNFANEAYDSIRPIADLVKKSTGSGLGAKVDTLASFFGKGTEGAQAIAQLEPLVYPLVANVPRFQGSQSDYDVKMYQKAAGDFANGEKPIATRLAALQGMISLLKKYDKEGKNDWTFGGSNPSAPGGIRIINRERVQ
jgi:hypothetical protein